MKRDVLPIVFGVIISTALAGTLVIAGLKAGITPGVSPLVILMAWGLFFGVMAKRGGGTRFLNLTQVAGSAGMAVTAGVIFTAPLVQILYQERGLPVPAVDVVTLMILSLSGAFIGFGFVGLATRKFLSDPTLPAPEARACQVMIEAAVTEKAIRPRLGRSLVAGLAASFIGPLLSYMGLAKEKIELLSRSADDGTREATLALPFSPIYIGIGGLLTLGTALLVFAGSFLRLAGDWLLAGVSAGTDAATLFPANSMRWVGGGAMTVAVAYSLFKFMRIRMPLGGTVEGDDARLIEVDPSRKRGQVISIIFGTLIMLGWLFTSGASTGFALTMAVAVLAMCTLMVALGAILSLQIGSSASPVSGTIFVTTLVLCLVALATGHSRIEDVLILTPLLVGACVAVCTANDSSQDYKTLQFCGVRVQDGFLAQILGLIGACIVVPLVLYVAYEAYGFGEGTPLPAPQGQMFATLIEGLLLESQLPWYPIMIGLAVGVGAVALDVFAQRKGHQLPSMALAVGIYLPAAIGIGILIGASFRRFAEGKRDKPRNESILAAAGLITGAAALDLIIGVLLILPISFTLADLQLFGEGKVPIPTWIPVVLGALGILVLASIIWVNSRPDEREAA
jgi:putative OPT family oligopeptide transporter